MKINMQSGCVELQSMQWGTRQPSDRLVKFEELRLAKAGDSFESEPYTMARESHHERIVVRYVSGYPANVCLTVHVDGYTPEENSEYFEYEYDIVLILPDEFAYIRQLAEVETDLPKYESWDGDPDARSKSLFLGIVEQCQEFQEEESSRNSARFDSNNIVITLPGDDEIDIDSTSSENSSDEDLFGAETLRKLGIARE